MRYNDLSDIGGGIWWLFVRFCRTELEKEQSKEYWARNIFVLILIFIILIGVSVTFFDN